MTCVAFMQSQTVLRNSTQYSINICYNSLCTADWHFLVAPCTSSIHFTLQTTPNEKVWRCQVRWIWWSTKSSNWFVNIYLVVWASPQHPVETKHFSNPLPHSLRVLIPKRLKPTAVTGALLQKVMEILRKQVQHCIWRQGGHLGHICFTYWGMDT